MISCYVDRILVPAEQVAVRDMNFGQPVPALQPRPYRLLLPSQSIIEAMADYYYDFASDDHQHGTLQDHPTTLSLRRLAWPPFALLAADFPELFVAFLRDHASYETLLALFTTSVQARYCLNTIEQVAGEGRAIRFTGLCYERAV